MKCHLALMILPMLRIRRKSWKNCRRHCNSFLEMLWQRNSRLHMIFWMIMWSLSWLRKIYIITEKYFRRLPGCIHSFLFYWLNIHFAVNRMWQIILHCFHRLMKHFPLISCMNRKRQMPDWVCRILLWKIRLKPVKNSPKIQRIVIWLIHLVFVSLL